VIDHARPVFTPSAIGYVHAGMAKADNDPVEWPVPAAREQSNGHRRTSAERHHKQFVWVWSLVSSAALNRLVCGKQMSAIEKELGQSLGAHFRDDDCAG
jgi:hypothetical protein